VALVCLPASFSLGNLGGWVPAYKSSYLRMNIKDLHNGEYDVTSYADPRLIGAIITQKTTIVSGEAFLLFEAMCWQFRRK
jgi:hypothetical protein